MRACDAKPDPTWRPIGSLGIRPLTDREFELFQGLIHHESGIHLKPTKKALLVGRLSRRLRALGLDSFTAYYHLLCKDEGGELARMLDRICTNETAFFREPKQFAFLQDRVFPAWRAEERAGRRTPRARVLSAGCATGEEPCSLAMILLEHLPPESGWRVSVDAVDLSTEALAQARAGVWPVERADEIPTALLKRFMRKGTGTQKGRMKAADDLRAVIRFRQLNLHRELHEIQGPFDLVFCRNTLIYFDRKSRLRVIHRLLDVLAPGGLLFLGHAESLQGLTERAVAVSPTVYRVRRTAAGPGEGRDAKALAR